MVLAWCGAVVVLVVHVLLVLALLPGRHPCGFVVAGWAGSMLSLTSRARGWSCRAFSAGHLRHPHAASAPWGPALVPVVCANATPRCPRAGLNRPKVEHPPAATQPGRRPRRGPIRRPVLATSLIRRIVCVGWGRASPGWSLGLATAAWVVVPSVSRWVRFREVQLTCRQAWVDGLPQQVRRGAVGADRRPARIPSRARSGSVRCSRVPPASWCGDYGTPVR
jgi:hypothetical protein